MLLRRFNNPIRYFISQYHHKSLAQELNMFLILLPFKSYLPDFWQSFISKYLTLLTRPDTLRVPWCTFWRVMLESNHVFTHNTPYSIGWKYIPISIIMSLSCLRCQITANKHPLNSPSSSSSYISSNKWENVISKDNIIGTKCL